MKKILIFLTILLSGIFSNVAFGDIIIPGQNCHNYDKNCYNECLKSEKYKSYYYDEKGKCIDYCCKKKKKYCTDKFCTCLIKGGVWPLCKREKDCYRDCTNGEVKILTNTLYLKVASLVLVLGIILSSILIYKKIKKSKKG